MMSVPDRMEELQLEADRQHGYEASRRHYWKVAIPVFAVGAIVTVGAAVVWVATTAGSVLPG
jgi:hypothetical protein